MTSTESSGTGWPAPRVSAASVGGRMLLLAMLILSGSAVALYLETFASMVSVWNASSTFVYGFLILPISAFMVWQKRDALRLGSVRPSVAGFSLLGLAVIVWLLSSEAYAQVGQHFALIAIITTSIWSVLGTDNARAIRFPLLFAFFAVPFGEFLIPPLMDWTAGFTVWALNATGIPVYLEAYVFALPSGTFEVVEACSGIRYLLVTVVLSIFFAHEGFSTVKRRIFFVLGATVAIIAANGIRAYLIVLIAHFSEMKFGTGQDHIYFGWFVFMVSIFLILWVGSRFSDRSKVKAVAYGAGSVRAGGTQERLDRTAFVSMAVAIAIIAMGPLAQRIVNALASDRTVVSTLPQGIDSWSGPGPVLLTYRPMFGGDFQAMHGSYGADGDTVDVHGIFFAEQNQGNELISQRNKLVDSRHWRLVQRIQTETVPLEGKAIEVNSLVVTDGRQNVLLWYWYDVGGWRTTSDVVTKIYHALQGVVGRDTGDAVLILATPASQSGDGRDSARLREFLDSHIDALSACLRSSPTATANCTDSTYPVR